MRKILRTKTRYFAIAFCAILASIYIYPVFSGLILLPLDLLVSNSSPWQLAGQILLKNPYMQDSVLQMFPWRHLTFISLTRGIIPLWNPYQFMGLPFMAGMKPLVFYPANIFFIFGELKAWNILLWLQLFLSLWFTCLFVTSLGMGIEVALFAGIAFAFNSLMVSVLEFGSEGHVLLWLPVLLYFAKRFIDTAKPWLIAGIAVGVASAIFAGQLQYFAYIALVTVAFTLWYGVSAKKPLQTIIMPLVGIALGCFIAGIQITPGIEMYQKSYRNVIGSFATFSVGLLKPYQLLKLLSPDWFGNPVTSDLRGGYIEMSGYLGIIPLFFIIYAVLYGRLNRFVRFFTGTALIALLFSMDGIAQILYTLRIPVITGGYGGRIFSMVLFSGAVLSGLGLNIFINDNQNHRKLRTIVSYLGFVALCFVGGMLAAHWGNSAGVHFTNVKTEIAAIFAFGVAAVLYVKYGNKIPFGKTLFIGAVLILTFGDLFRMGYRFLTFSNKKFLYPDIAVTGFVRNDSVKSLGRTYGIAELEVNTELGVAGVETYNPFFPARTATFLQALENKQNTTIMDNKYELALSRNMKPALDFLGVDKVVVLKDENPAIMFWRSSEYENDITKIFEADRNVVYRNATALPRFELLYDVRPDIPDEDALIALSLQSIDFRKTVLLKESLRTPIGIGTGSAELLSSGINTMEFNVNTTAPAIFYLSDSYDSGWHASVNGRETPVYHANYNFRGVTVPAGRSKVVFWYLPESVIIGAIISVLGIAGTLGLLTYGYKISNRKNKSQSANRKTGTE
jgi:hypothetical protein